MKKILAVVLLALCLTGCVHKAEVEAEMYIVPGHYYTSGQVITLDGNVWGYAQDIIDEEASYDGQSVLVIFYDAKTPEYIYDDEIVGLIGNIAHVHE